MAMGGNKLRKLEFLAADALREGADTLITAGAIQSNHVRQTAAVAAKLATRVALLENPIGTRAENYLTNGNRLLLDLFNVQVEMVDALTDLAAQLGSWPRWKCRGSVRMSFLWAARMRWGRWGMWKVRWKLPSNAKVLSVCPPWSSLLAVGTHAGWLSARTTTAGCGAYWRDGIPQRCRAEVESGDFTAGGGR